MRRFFAAARGIVGLAACLMAMSVQAKTLALWPMELDPDTGTFDGRCLTDPAFDLTLTDSGNTGLAQGVGWNLPPNPEPAVNLMLPAVNRTAVRGSRSAAISGQTMIAPAALALAHLSNTNDFTVEGWIKFDANPGGSSWTIILQALGGSTKGNGGWFLSWRGNEGARILRLTVSSGVTGGNYDDTIGPQQLSAATEASLMNAWHHLALTHKTADGKSVWKLYLDGENTIDGTAATVTVNANGAFTEGTQQFLYFGGRPGNSQRLNAAFDYWRVSDEALEPEDFLCAGGDGTTVPDAATATNTTVAYWKLGRNADGSLDTRDSVGRANLHGGFLPTRADQPITNAASAFAPDAACAFAGDPPNATAALGGLGNAGSLLARHSNSYATSLIVPGLGAKLEPAANSFTVEAYMKPLRREKIQNQFLLTTRNANNGWGLQLLPIGGRWRLAIMAEHTTGTTGDKYNPKSSTSGYKLIGDTDMTDWDDWKHVALVYEAGAGENKAGQWRLYLDGAAAGTVDADEWTDTTGSSYFYIGGRSHNADRNHHNFCGWIDCVRVCQAALTPAQFLCTAGGAAATDVLAYWPLNRTNGSFDGTDLTGNYTLQDAHGAGNFPVASADAPTVTNPDRSANFDGNAAAQTGSALFRDGASRNRSHLETNDPDVYNLINNANDYTFECWFKRNARTSEKVWNAVFLTPRTVSTYGQWLALNQIFSYLDGDGFRIEDQQAEGGATAFANSDGQPVGVWRHLALTRKIVTDGDTKSSLYSLYLDGAFVSSVTKACKYTQSAQCLRIGGRPDDANAWAGQLADIRLSNAVLEPSQFLCANADTGTAATDDAATIVYWPFDNADGAADTTPAAGPAGFDLRARTDGGATGAADAAATRLPSPYTGLPRANAGSVALAENAYMRSLHLGTRLSTETAFTVEGWLKWDGATRGGRVTVCGQYDATAASTGDRKGWKLLIDDTGDAPQFGVYARSGCNYTPMANGLFTKRPAKPGAWQHVALAYDPAAGARGVWTLYLDGKEAGTVENDWRDATLPAVEAYFKFGRLNDVTATGFSGNLDLWRISSGARAADDLLCANDTGTLMILR